jgi:hypothetical protein
LQPDSPGAAMQRLKIANPHKHGWQCSWQSSGS